MHGLAINDPKLNFSSSHFIVDHERCERLHGHNYRVRAEVTGALLDSFMVMDFKEIKDRINAVCERLDHKVLLPKNSSSLVIKEKSGQLEVKTHSKFYSLPKEDCVLLPIKATTAEELARYVFRELKKSLPQLRKIYVAESEGSTAFYSED